MFIRSSCAIAENSYFLTLGDSCFYVFAGEAGLHLIDTGSAVHAPQLIKRFQDLELQPKEIVAIYLSNANPARIAGLPWILKSAPDAGIFCSKALQAFLQQEENLKLLFEANTAIDALLPKIRFEAIDFETFKRAFDSLQVLDDSPIALGNDLSLRYFDTPGYSRVSTGFYVPEIEFFIGDQTFGYFRGRDLPAPGGDYSLVEAKNSHAALSDVPIGNFAFHFAGFLSGELGAKYLRELSEASASLEEECSNAIKAGVPEAEIIESLQESVYSSIFSDPVLALQMQNSLTAIWNQLRQSAS